MNVSVWIVSGLLAAVYLGVGGIKLVVPREKLIQNPNMAVAQAMSQSLIYFVGAVEVLGGLGLILPALTGIAPILTPVAAAGLALLQICAAIFHSARREFKQLPGNIVLFALAAFVAYERIQGLG